MNAARIAATSIAAAALLLPLQSARPQAPIDWKPFFTLRPEEGTGFRVDSTAVIPEAGVPGINIANDGRVVLGWGSTTAGGRRAGTTPDTGRTFIPLTGVQQPMHVDAAFIYFPDGRTRFVAEEPLPNRPPTPHKSRLISYISTDGLNWTREPGVRYQPGPDDDSIASVPSALQIRDSLWRLYYVGDWYRTNGTRTALSTDWGLTWQPESRTNILRPNDVDPHPMYLTDGRVRIYHRNMRAPGGIGYTDGDGFRFDTAATRMLIPDGSAFTDLKLDPAVVRFPGGRIACYIGAAPAQPGNHQPKVIVAWGLPPTGVSPSPPARPAAAVLHQNFPNPFNPTTTIRYDLREHGPVRITVRDVLGREVTVLVDAVQAEGYHAVTFDAANLPSGVYFCSMRAGPLTQSVKLLLVR